MKLIELNLMQNLKRRMIRRRQKLADKRRRKMKKRLGLDNKQVTEQEDSNWYDDRNNVYAIDIELLLSDTFTEEDADDVISKLTVSSSPHGKIVERIKYPIRPTQIDGDWGINYHILFPTKEDAQHTKKILRRLQRGKPRFTLTYHIVEENEHTDAWRIHSQAPLTAAEKFEQHALAVTLVLSNTFKEKEADNLILKLTTSSTPNGKIINRIIPFPSDVQAYDIELIIEYQILFPTEKDAIQAKKVLRRQQRGKPQFEVVDTDIYIPNINILMAEQARRSNIGIKRNITKKDNMLEYFGQMTGVNQASSYPQAQTSGLSLTKGEKKQLRTSKQRFYKKKKQGFVDWVKSQYNEAEEDPTVSWDLELKLTNKFTYKDAKNIVDQILGNSGGIIRLPTAVTTAYFRISFPSIKAYEQAKKTLRRLRRGEPKFSILHSKLW